MPDKILEILKQERESFNDDVNVHSHSAFFMANDDGEIIHRAKSAICYREFTVCGKKSKYIFLYFGKELRESRDRPEIWFDWIINKSGYADAFITKDVDEGLELGFQLDTSQPRGMWISGAVALRNVIEMPNWSFAKYLDLGLSCGEAYKMCTNWSIEDGGVLNSRSYASNHLVLPARSSLSAFEGKLYDEDFAIGANFGTLDILCRSFGGDVKHRYDYCHDIEKIKGLKKEKITVKTTDFFDDTVKEEVVNVYLGTEKNVRLILNQIGKI